jgi:hypothetical protein
MVRKREFSRIRAITDVRTTEKRVEGDHRSSVH